VEARLHLEVQDLEEGQEGHRAQMSMAARVQGMMKMRHYHSSIQNHSLLHQL